MTKQATTRDSEKARTRDQWATRRLHAGPDIRHERMNAQIVMRQLVSDIAKALTSVRFIEPPCIGKSDAAKKHHEVMKAGRAAIVAAWREKIEACQNADSLLRLLNGHHHYEQFEPATNILLKLKSLDCILVSYPSEAERRATKLEPAIKQLSMSTRKGSAGALPPFFEI